MLPFRTMDKSSLPENLRPFYPIVVSLLSESRMILRLPRTHISYLTVHESVVRANDSQRRAGLHIETPGRVAVAEMGFETVGWGVGMRQSKVIGRKTFRKQYLY